VTEEKEKLVKEIEEKDLTISKIEEQKRLLQKE